MKGNDLKALIISSSDTVSYEGLKTTSSVISGESFDIRVLITKWKAWINIALVRLTLGFNSMFW